MAFHEKLEIRGRLQPAIDRVFEELLAKGRNCLGDRIE
jgi:hypothetical protein